jgi:hypothetical protein
MFQSTWIRRFVLVLSFFIGSKTFATDINFDFKCNCHRLVNGQELGFEGFQIEFFEHWKISDQFVSAEPNSAYVGVLTFTADHSNNFVTSDPGLHVGTKSWARWIAGLRRIFPGDKIHGGYSVEGSTIPWGHIYFFFRNDSLQWQAVDDCAPTSLGMQVHADGKKLVFEADKCPDGNAPKETPKPKDAFIINAKAEFYSKRQPLETLNATTPRKPIKVEEIEFKPNKLTCGESTEATLAPPDDAEFVVVDFQTDTDRSLKSPGAMRVWVQVPLRARNEK